MTLPLHIFASSTYRAEKLGKLAPTHFLLALCLPYTFITHILNVYYVLGHEDTVANSVDSTIRDPSCQGPQICKKKVQSMG